MSDLSPDHSCENDINDEPFTWLRWYFELPTTADQLDASVEQHQDEKENDEELGDKADAFAASEKTDEISTQVPENNNNTAEVESENGSNDPVNITRSNNIVSSAINQESEQTETISPLSEAEGEVKFSDEIEAIMDKFNSLRQRVRHNREKVLKFHDELDDIEAQVNVLEARAIKTEMELREDMAHIDRVRAQLRERHETWREAVRTCAETCRNLPLRKQSLQTDLVDGHGESERTVAERLDTEHNSFESKSSDDRAPQASACLEHSPSSVDQIEVQDRALDPEKTPALVSDSTTKKQ